MNANTIQPEIAYKLNSRILFFDGIFSLIAIIAFIFSLNILGISLINSWNNQFFSKSKTGNIIPTNSVIKKYSIFFDKQDMAALEKSSMEILLMRRNILSQTTPEPVK